MHPALSVLTPQCIATEAFTNATAAVARLDEIYERNTAFLRDCFGAHANGETISTRVRATYPLVRITTMTHARLDSRLSYGFVARPGVYETTVTRPDLFRAYLTEQIKLLIENHAVPVEIGESNEPIPIHFAYRRDINIEALLTEPEKLRIQRPVRDVFDTPDLAAMDDAIANGTLQGHLGTPEPLALFRAARVDYSLHRLLHYTGTDPEHFQNFVIFTNYQFYVDAFRHLGHEHMASGRSGAEAFVEPGNLITRNARLGGGTSGVAPERMPQMPAFHLVEPNYRGITMINIGTGPSNARTTRPRACGSACRVAAAERRIENDRKSNANRGRAGLERAQLELSVIESQLLCAASSATMTTMRGRLVPVIKLMWLLPAGGRPSRQSGGPGSQSGATWV